MVWTDNFWSDVQGNVPVFVATLLILIAASFKIAKNQKKATPKEKKPWPTVPGSFLVGNALQLGDPRKDTQQLRDWADQYGKECGVFEINIAGSVFLCVCREDVTMQILRQRPFKVVRNARLRSAINSCNVDGLFSSEGDDWKLDKRLVSPTLNHAAISKYFPSVKTVTKRLLDKWTELSRGGSAVVINQDCFLATIDVAGLVFAGTDFQSLQNPNSVRSRDIANIGSILTRRVLAPFEYWRIPLIGNYLDRGGWVADRIRRSLEEIIARHEEKQAQGGNVDCNVVAKLVAFNKRDENRFSRRRLIGNIATMFVAGTDATGATLATSIWLLATDTTGLQEELAEEAAKLDFDTVTLNEIFLALPRLRSFMYETQRIYSAFHLMHFDVAEEIPFLDSTLPVGTQILSMIRYTSTNPHQPPTGVPLGPHGEDHTQYCPRRWLVVEPPKKGGPTENVSVQVPSPKQGAFLPFGHGVRSCPGREFSESMSLFVLSSLVAKFHLSLEKNHPLVGRINVFAESPDVDVSVQLKPRIFEGKGTKTHGHNRTTQQQ